MENTSSGTQQSFHPCVIPLRESSYREVLNTTLAAFNHVGHFSLVYESLQVLLGFLYSLLNLFLGTVGGSMGETSALALLIGFVYLLCRRVITWHTPVAFIGTVFVLALVKGGFMFGLAEILAGGVFLGAIFMATDYVTTPQTPWGRVIFGIGCGLITCLIRFFGNYPEGVSFSILLMNILTPYISNWTAKKPLGGVEA